MSARRTVLLFAPADDIHVLAVKRRLALIGGDAAFGRIVDTRTFPCVSSVDWCTREGRGLSAELRLANPMVAGAGREAAPESPSEAAIDLDDIVSAWLRRPGEVGVDRRIQTEEFRDYAALAARAALGPVFAARPTFNKPAVEQRLRWKPLQLLRAEGCGIRIPRTLVTASSTRALEFVDWLAGKGRAVIYKQVASTPDGPPTRLFHAADRDRINDVELCPTLFQERIEGGVDLRIAIIGGRIFAAEWRRDGAPSPDVDVRLDRHATLWPVVLPDTFGQQLIRLQASLELDIGIYDFKCDQDGTPYFLEVNPSGQWLALEVEAGWPVSWHLARLLARSDDDAPAPEAFQQADLTALMHEMESALAARRDAP